MTNQAVEGRFDGMEDTETYYAGLDDEPATQHAFDAFDALVDFVTESNRIEGIRRRPTVPELTAHATLLGLSDLTVDDIARFVGQVQPGAELRAYEGMNVRVGNHIPPPGHPTIKNKLDELLFEANGGFAHPFDIHQRYEHLHPFMDGNGRSGRAIWLWQMVQQGDHSPLDLGFLHLWYYQSLQADRRR